MNDKCFVCESYRPFYIALGGEVFCGTCINNDSQYYRKCVDENMICDLFQNKIKHNDIMSQCGLESRPRWISLEPIKEYHQYHRIMCSNCGEIYNKRNPPSVCPNCKEKMKKRFEY